MSSKLARSNIKAQVKAAREAASRAPSLPEELERHLESFAPKRLSAAEWAAARPLALEILRRAETTSLTTLESVCPPVAGMVAWALREGHPAEWRSICTHAVVDEWIRTASPYRTEGSRSTTRSRLRALASRANPGPWAPSKPEAIGYKAIRPPYSAYEQRRIREIALTQPSNITGRQVAISVGVGFGAGGDAIDMRHLKGGHFVDLGADNGIRVEFPGSRPRIVWVRRDWEEVIRVGLVGLANDDPVIGKNPGRHNVTASIYERAVILGDPIEFDQSRMRATWLVELMAEPIPVATLMRAAGLKSGRTLCDLLPYVPETLPVIVRGEQDQ